MEVLHQCPESDSFVPLAEHQSRTPQSFYDGPPILHHLSEHCKVVTSEGELRACPALGGLRNTNGSGSAHAAGEVEADERDVVIDDVDVWVTSGKFILFSHTTASGVSIPYPSISLHAIQRLPLPATSSSSSSPTNSTEPVQGLYMQLAMSENVDEPGDEDMEEESVSLTIVPQQIPSAAGSTQAETATGTGSEGTTENQQAAPQTATETLFAAVSACSNLHPDVLEEGDNDQLGAGDQGLLNDSILAQNGLIFPGANGSGALPPPMPGSGGWITADNVHEYFDEEGNWKGDGEPGDDGEEQGEEAAPLGPGAGSVRTREDDADAAGGDGPDGEEDETKWRRTG